MKNTLIWQVVKSFSVAEQREFGEFLDSPFVNKRSDLKVLYQYLAKMAKSKKGTADRRDAYQLIFPGQPYNDQEMRLALSYLFKVAERFLIWKEYENNKLKQQVSLLAAYRKRHLTAHFQKALNRSQKILDQQPFRHPELYLEKYQIEHERYLFLSETGRTKELNLQEVEDNLTAAMLGMKLRQACFLRSHETVFNTSYDTHLVEELLALAGQPAFAVCPAVSLYSNCYRALFLVHNEKVFQGFKRHLFENVEHFPKEEMRDLYLLAINFCIKKVNDGRASFYREALDLYKSGLSTALLIKDHQLSRFTYNNIVAVAIRLPAEWKWAGWFVKAYREYLPEAHQEAAFSLNSARLAFVKKDYDNALVQLLKADYKDLINNMVAKTLQLKIYFEMQEMELLDSHLRTMRMFIRRNKKMAYHRENWSNIVRYTQKLMEVNPFDLERKKQLEKAILSEETLTEKEWLIKQLRA
ncbi:MAG: hypothetical protein AAFZ15_04535 [Bacteroidota bacterium]